MKYKVITTQFSPIEQKEFVIQETGEVRAMLKFTVFRAGDGFIPVILYDQNKFDLIQQNNIIEVKNWRPKQSRFIGKDGKKRTYFNMILESFDLANEVEVSVEQTEAKNVEQTNDYEIDESVWED